MKTKLALLLPVLIALTLAQAGAAVRYVNLANPSPAPPYASWATAATNIQDAVDSAQAGDTVLVTNGIYASGAREVYGMSNRVAVTKPVTVRSVNGPELTVIQGYQVPGTATGDGAVRCVFLTSDATIAGFTLTKGATRHSSDRGPYDELSGGGVWCESVSAVVSNCTIVGNSARVLGGGAFRGVLLNCRLAANSAHEGEGAAESILHNCTLTGNSAIQGGGAIVCTVNNSVVTRNSAGWGGGVDQSFVRNCTITFNSAENDGGGTHWADIANCIIYHNRALRGSDSWSAHSISNSCTTTSGSFELDQRGNIDTNPQLVTASHVSPGSPCRDAGNAGFSIGTDIDGEPWLTPPSMGCDEYRSNNITIPLTVTVEANYAYVVPGFIVDFTAFSQGSISAGRWEFDDGIVVSNQPTASRSWVDVGDHTVVFRGFNQTHPNGVTATSVVHVSRWTHFVGLNSTNPTPPFLSWATAATNIQDAVDAANEGGALILVTNGVYSIGKRYEPYFAGATPNRLSVNKKVTVQSVNGPDRTAIQGRQVPEVRIGDSAIRCAYLGNGAALIGFTLMNGTAQEVITLPEDALGGGVLCHSTNALVMNCVQLRTTVRA